jgi:hypothetical protein
MSHQISHRPGSRDRLVVGATVILDDIGRRDARTDAIAR